MFSGFSVITATDIIAILYYTRAIHVYCTHYSEVTLKLGHHSANTPQYKYMHYGHKILHALYVVYRRKFKELLYM